MHPNSVVSSPRYHYHNETTDLPHVPGTKLRLLCSYGGHIMPRDNSLYYVGGDTRIVAVDRHSSLTHLCSHLSRNLLHGRRSFTLKYHLPNEDLDNLITVSTDEDLQNMIEEYDRLSSNPSPSPSRLRLFLFFSKPETAVSMDTLHHDSNNLWFVEALNNSGILSRVVSDSAAVVDNCLLNLDDYDASASSCTDENTTNTNVNKEHLIDVDYSVPVDEEDNVFNYSFDNLPQIRVRMDEQKLVEMEQQQDNNIDDVKVVNAKQDDAFLVQSQVKSDQNQQEEQVNNSAYTSPQQQPDQNPQQPATYQHQFVYINHPIGTGQVPISSYYPYYAPQSHQQLNQFPVYVMPIGLGSTQPYNMALQSNIADTNVVASTRPQIPQSIVPEVTPSVYKAPVASNSGFIQIPSNQFQQQCMNLSQNIHHPLPAHPIYGYDYGGAMQEQVYYTQTQQQHANANPPSQYQSMTPAVAAAAISDVSKQFPIDNIQQPNKNSQQV